VILNVVFVAKIIGIIFLALNIYIDKQLQPLTGYSQAGLGENCPTAGVITSNVICEDALRSLGLNPYDITRRYSANEPAGCYWSSDGRGRFNTIIDPSLTNPNKFGGLGGVCTITVGKNWE
tara:strand:- start:55 stop:417 length:363 start_codon:yes stop_codon:yes gene_type:complete